MNILTVLVGVVLAGLAGCAAHLDPKPSHDGLFADASFKPPTVRIVPSDALELSPEMKSFAESHVRPEMHMKGPREGLIDSLYTKGRLQLDYDSTDTRSAAQAFAAKRGNCMSLVLLTAAFARHFGLEVTFNSVYLDEQWTRAYGLFFVAGHVNITLARGATPIGRVGVMDDDLLTVDFIPAGLLRGQRRRVVQESTILAMYLNNRAAETLAAGQVDNAYWWARAAIETDPRWLPVYNTLAVIYRRHGMNDRAESTLRLVLDREPLNAEALSNLVLVLGDAGRQAEAKTYAERLAQIQPVPPYHYFDEGVEAMRVGDFGKAKSLFGKEVARASYVSEFHFWLALASYGLGDLPATRGELTKAMENSSTTTDRDLYGAKLAWLKEQRRH